jgi:UDP-GlcNAc:undecaprenyl-phosphate/decaprenyl-phosphate GlcNAc-1-phosphate transferase
VVALPLALSLGIAALIAPPLVATLGARGRTRPNHRGTRVPFPTGLVILATSVLTLASLALLGGLTGLSLLPSGASTAAVFVIGVALVGLVDDLLGDHPRLASRGSGPARAGGGVPAERGPSACPRGLGPRGLRGHARALARGRPSTGALKATGTLVLAVVVVSEWESSAAEGALAVAVLVLAAHAFNLLDLRPGRSIKALVLLGAGLTLGSLELDPLWTLGWFVGPILVLLPLDLRERGMLGDTGSNAIGAVAGLWLVLTLSVTGQLVALAVIALITVYGEFRSISALIERNRLLRGLDSLGRANA